MDQKYQKDKSTISMKDNFKDALKSISIKKNSDGIINLEYQTAFKFLISFTILCSVIALGFLAYYEILGPVLKNIFVYSSILTAIALLIYIQSKFKTVIVLDTTRSILYRKRTFFSSEFISGERPFSDVVFVTIRTKPSYVSKGTFSEHYICLILKDGTIINISESIKVWNVKNNIPEAQEIAAILKVKFIEPETENSVKVRSTPVIDESSLSYINIKRLRKRSALIIIGLIIFSFILAIIVSIILSISS